MKIISVGSNKDLAKDIADSLKKKGVKADFVDAGLSKFSDGELRVELQDDTLAGEDCILVQSIAPSRGYSVNDNLMGLSFVMDALKNIPVASATVIMPYLGYARQDRRVFPRSPISSKVVIDQICSMGVSAAVTMDIHADQLLGFFNCPVRNLQAVSALLDDIRGKFPDLSNVVLVAPDMGSVKRTRLAAKELGCECVVVDKNRSKPGVSEVMNIFGDYKGKDCVLIDDMIDTAGTLCNAAEALMEGGAKSVAAYASHGVFSGPAMCRIDDSVLSEVVVMDTISKDGRYFSDKIRFVSSADMFADVIKNDLFAKKYVVEKKQLSDSIGVSGAEGFALGEKGSLSAEDIQAFVDFLNAKNLFARIDFVNGKFVFSDEKTNEK